MSDGLRSEPAQRDGCALAGTDAAVVLRTAVIAQAKVGNLDDQVLTHLSGSIQNVIALLGSTFLSLSFRGEQIEKCII